MVGQTADGFRQGRGFRFPYQRVVVSQSVGNDHGQIPREAAVAIRAEKLKAQPFAAGLDTVPVTVGKTV